MRTLVCGSLAFDTIMVFPDHFSRHILREQAHVLSVSFTVGEMRREWGGCAGNIAYNLKHIGGEPVVMATVGDDGDDYRERLAAFGIGIDTLRQVPGTYTAQAFIITDLDDNQITAFTRRHEFSHQNRVSDAPHRARHRFARRQGGMSRTPSSSRARASFLFDPGQEFRCSATGAPGDVEKAQYVAVNDYEGRMLVGRTGVPLAGIAERVDALIVTLGGEGRIHAGSDTFAIPAAKPTAVLDPTGCGDAYRAGLLYGLAQGWDWQRTGGLAPALGALKIASRGAQNHVVNRETVDALYRATFGAPLW
jgi:adenosine kinase